MAKSTSKVKRPKKAGLTPAQKQKQLLEGSQKRFTKPATHIHAVFLVRQGLRSRSEQFMCIAANYNSAEFYCRNTLTPKYCKDNEKNALHFTDKKGERLDCNFSNDLLMIKGKDFVRTEQGRSNSNPLWYWNIAPVRVVHIVKDK